MENDHNNSHHGQGYDNNTDWAHRVYPVNLDYSTSRNDRILLVAACKILARMGYDFRENPELMAKWANIQKEAHETEVQEIKQAMDRKMAIAATTKPAKDLTGWEINLMKRFNLLS